MISVKKKQDCLFLFSQSCLFMMMVFADSEEGNSPDCTKLIDSDDEILEQDIISYLVKNKI